MKISFQNRVLIPIIIALFLFFSFCGFFLLKLSDKKIEDYTVELLTVSNNILTKNIHSLARNYLTNVRSIANMPQLQKLAMVLTSKETTDKDKELALAEVQKLFIDLPNIFSFFKHLNFSDANGLLLASTNTNIIQNMSIQDREHFKLVMQGQEVISQPIFSRSVKGTKAVIFAVPLKGLNGQICGMLHAVVPCDWLINDTIKDIKMAKYGYAYIVDGTSGLVLAHTDVDQIIESNIFKNHPNLKNLSKTKTDLSYNFKDDNGKEFLSVYAKEPTSGWIIISTIGRDELVKQMADVNYFIAVILFGSLVLVSLILIFILRLQIKDVLKINAYANEIISGHYEAQLDVKRKDEVGNLARDVFHMATKLKQMLDLSAKLSLERDQKLTSMRDFTIFTLANLVESRDLNTGEHIHKTAIYAGIITKELLKTGLFKDQISTAYLRQIIAAAPLHDIGKIKVPDAILNKPGKLTTEEFEIMKTHTSIGGEVLDEIIAHVPDTTYLKIAKDIAKYHHEKWNGKGYPEALAGDTIPLAARIMAVADVFDALVSARPYKPAFSLDKAFTIIQEERGQHFDPRVVDAFFAAKDIIIKAENDFHTTPTNKQPPNT